MTVTSTAPNTKTEFNLAFEQFVNGQEASDILSSFAVIQRFLPPPYSFESLRDFALPLLSYKRKALLSLFECKLVAAKPEAPVDPKTVVISGAGPVGLRSAIEAVAVGFKVVVIELRTEFSRHNVIKTWSDTITDLTSLGLAHFCPQFTPNGSLHLGIKEIQTCLLKAALLLGVHVRYEMGVCGIVDPVVGLVEDSKWAVWTLPASEARRRLKKRAELDGLATEEVAPELTLQPGEQDLSRLQRKNRVDYFEPAVSQDDAVIRGLEVVRGEELTAVQKQLNLDVEMIKGMGACESKVELIPFDYLLVAEGESSRLIRHLGFDRKIWKFANMIGIVVNFDITPSALLSSVSPERMLKEFVVTRAAATWKQGPLGKLFERGYDLENLEYLRSMKTHFFVCTIKKQTLASCGIVKEDKSDTAQLLAYENLDMTQLEVFAHELAKLAGIPSSCTLSQKHGVQIFDFSCKGQCTDQIRRLSSTTGTHSLVLPVGDALQNPYWPQGLGVNRGFHSAFDAVHAVYVDTTQGFEAAVFERLTAFRLMDFYPLQEMCLQTPYPLKGGVKTGTEKTHDWTMDPLTRYSRMIFKGIHMSDVENAGAPSLPVRMRRFWGLGWGVGGGGAGGGKENEGMFPEVDVEATMKRLALGYQVTPKSNE
ncbi:[F-actin]-monooxygenase mical3 [Podochytrium sp. JEL0797]|nr:[F-actin]-monooxygenase mical3 [Podochytrium sp. JEL0797]